MTEIQFAADLGVVIPATTKCVASVAIKFDDEDSMVAELRGRSGWIRDQDGDAHRMQRLGDERLIHHEAKWKCETCGAEFDNERCLRGHTSGKWCRKREDKTEAQQMKLRQTRKTSQARRGQVYRVRWNRSTCSRVTDRGPSLAASSYIPRHADRPDLLRDARSQTALRHSVCRVRVPQHSMALIVHCYRPEGVPILRTRPVSDVFQRRGMANLKH